MNTWKIIQRKTYDVLSHKYFLIGVFPSCLLSVVLLSIIEIGEVWMVWSAKSASGKLGKVTIERACADAVGIDVVYTWVNGSDPLLIQNLKHIFKEETLVESWTDCPYAGCTPSHIIFYRGCKPLTRALQNLLPLPHMLQKSYPSLNKSEPSACSNATEVRITFVSVNDATQALHIRNMSGSLLHAFWTTDMTVPGSYPSLEWVSLAGFSSKFLAQTSEVIQKRLSRQFNIPILEVWTYPEFDSIILKLPTFEAVDNLISRHRKLIINQDIVSINRVSLVLFNPYTKRQDRYAPSRFEDKEELRYSLRSLERHAPWIRHIYLVTNGQIPYWLNLDHQHITLVTHEDIFINKSHLPTFSSPAIESHLHRIKGLSEKFLYLNDDIMFAQDVWPEDFFTNSRGYKVYLSWPVPDCSPSCVWSWVSDGSCDSECNVVECGFDGGDCNETDSGPTHPHVHPIRDDFSIYDEMASKEFPPDMDSIILEKQMDADLEYLQPPDLIEANLRHPLSLNAPMVDEVMKRATLDNSSNLLHLREVSLGRKEQRGVVKKNLASKDYIGSSMIAGQSADFLGSVTDSKTAIQEALHVANDLRRGNIAIPVHSNNSAWEPTTKFNRDLHSNDGLRFNGNVSIQEKSHHSTLEENHFLHRHFKTGPKPRDYSIVQQDSRILSYLFDETAQNMEDPVARKNASDIFEQFRRSNKKLRNMTELKKQKIRDLMEIDLNESARPLVNKGLRNRGKVPVRSLDAFAESLLHVNMLYNRYYGFEARRVPAHAPHFIDKEIMYKLQEKFSKEWEETSSHRLRDPHDMQFAFSYYYFLMSEEEDVHMEELFKNYDSDHSGTWSDREIRTLLTRLYPAPLNPNHLIQFEEIVLACSHNVPSTEVSPSVTPNPMYERYQDSPLPTVTWILVRDCLELKKLLLSHLGRKMKYKFEVVREWSRDITFKMLNSNVSHLVGYLDDIRRNPKKFVCLNDNLDPKLESENIMVRALLRDFYHSFFPTPSKYELPPDMRNRFLHVTELNEWKNNRSKLRFVVILAVVTLCLLTLAVVCPDEFRHYGRRVFEFSCVRRRRISRIRNTYPGV